MYARNSYRFDEIVWGAKFARFTADERQDYEFG
jgi:hypothetical protein